MASTRFMTLGLAALLLAGSTPVVYAQFNQGRGNIGGSNADSFNSNRIGNFNDYRVSLNEEYARMLREGKWDQKGSMPPKPKPKDDVSPIPTPYNDKDRRDDKEISIEEIITPDKDKSRAAPIAPVREDPTINTRTLSFNYFGSPVQVRIPSESTFSVGSVSADALASAWSRLSEPQFAPMVADIQKLKTQMQLCDWAYLQLIDAFAKTYSKNRNEATLLTAYLFSQSGYKIRLASTSSGLEMLYNSRHNLLEHPYYILDGEYYYPLDKNVSGNISICEAKFAKEKSLSLWVNSLPQIEKTTTPSRHVSSKRYLDFSVDYTVNKNLVDFYNTYPTSVLGTDFMTRWAMYAETPVSDHVRATLYPQLKSMIAGLDQLQAVERLLNWIQTGFVYEYDDKVWGGDRAFFPEETLYYPYCDCEDRSILLTRLVRDLLGLKCMLIYYPGHLAAAVAFNSPVSGDYITVSGTRYTVTDPTFIGAPVGRTMTGMDNTSAKVILLN